MTISKFTVTKALEMQGSQVFLLQALDLLLKLNYFKFSFNFVLNTVSCKPML